MILFPSKVLSIFWGGGFFSMNWAVPNSWMFKFAASFCRLD